MQKLFALWKLFRKGEEVANAVATKKGQVAANVLTGFLWALSHAAEVFGYAIPFDDQTVNDIAVGALATINVVCTVISSRKVGLLPERKSDPG